MLNSLKLRNSILLGFALPIAVFMLATVQLVMGLQDAEKATALVDGLHDISRKFPALEMAAGSMVRGAEGYILTQSPADKDTVDQADRDFLIAMEKVGALLTDPEQKSRIGQLHALQKEMLSAVRQEITLTDQGKLQAAVEMEKNHPVMTAWKNFQAIAGAFSEKQQSLLDERMAYRSGILQRIDIIIWTTVLVVTLLAVFLGVWIASRIIGKLKDSINSFATSSAEITATVEQHQRTVLSQSSSVNQTSATTEEVRVSAQTSFDQAENAASVVKKALQLAEEGSLSSQQASAGIGDLQEKVRAVAEQILQLSEQAGQIGLIAKVVGDLASETNMLALNAAVEAARAGDNGKGFAVVASEVRKLADQSKKSAERANQLVADIQKATNSAVMVAEEGSKTAKEVFNIAQQHGQKFQALAEYAHMIDQNAQQVVLNSRQQASALAQISDAMKNLNTGSMEMAAGTRQTNIGLQNLNDVAAMLKAMI